MQLQAEMLKQLVWTEQWQQWELPFPKGRAIPSSAGICATSHPHWSKSVQGDALPWPGHDCSLGSKLRSEENQTSITTTFGQDHPLGPALNHSNAELPTWDGTLAGGVSLPQHLLSVGPALGSDQLVQCFAPRALKNLHGQRSHRLSSPLHCPGEKGFSPRPARASRSALGEAVQDHTSPTTPLPFPEAGHKMLIHKNLFISLTFRKGSVPAVNYPLLPHSSSETVTGHQPRQIRFHVF